MSSTNLESFVERKIRLLKAGPREEKTHLKEISVNPALIKTLRNADDKMKSRNSQSQDWDTVPVCRRALVDKIIVENLAHNLSKRFPYSEGKCRNRWPVNTSRGRISQTADRLKHALATQELADRLSRDGHLYCDDAASRLADAIAGPVTALAAQLSDEALRIRDDARPASAAAAACIDATAALAASRRALSAYARVMPGQPK